MTITETLNPARTIAELVSHDPIRAALFDRFGLDYCCHGQRSLADACMIAAVPVADVLSALAESEAERSTPSIPTDVDQLADTATIEKPFHRGSNSLHWLDHGQRLRPAHCHA